MTDDDPIPDVIHIDYSISSTLRTCPEKARLSYVKSYRPVVTAPPLDFGSAWHRGIEKLYITGDIDVAKKAFTKELQDRESALPLSMDSDEKRSIERGLYLLEAYQQRWKNEPFEQMWYEIEGVKKPYVEIQFSVYICEWRGRPVMYSGAIDRIMTSKLTGYVVNVETKTTTQSLSVFRQQSKSNHQITGYYLASQSLGLNIKETIWDMTFVSSRKPDPEKGGWMVYGIDFEKDFGRVSTRRSDFEIDDFLQDLEDTALEYCERRWGDKRTADHWPRNAPTACSMYGGCTYRDVCSTRLNQDLINSRFKVEIWEPWNRKRRNDGA